MGRRIVRTNLWTADGDRAAMKALLDTNYLYYMLDPSDPEAADLARLSGVPSAFFSDVSILEWIVRQGHPQNGNLSKLQAGLSLIDRAQIRRLASPYVQIDANEISAFANAKALPEVAALHAGIVGRRMTIEHEWLRFLVAAAAGAYLTGIAQTIYFQGSPEWPQVLHLIPAILDANLSLIDQSVMDGLKTGYASGKHDRTLSDAIDAVRTSLVTVGRVFLEQLRGNALSKADIDQTLEISNFRLHLARAINRGHLDQFRIDLRADILRAGSKHHFLVEYLLQRLEKVISVGANQRKNDVFDGFVAGHLADGDVVIITRDQAMQNILGDVFQRPHQTPAQFLASMPP